MLDLQELEKRLNNALNNETPESLRQWLLDQRKSDTLSSFLGAGRWEEMKGLPFSFISEKCFSHIGNNDNTNYDPCEFAIAA